MSEVGRGGLHDRWARLRFSIVGPLLASPPGHGELRPAIDALSERTWIHPATGALVRFSASTIETWLYRACNGGDDPIGVLRKKVRTDAGVQWSITGPLEGRLLAMLEGVEELTLAQLNEATQAWVELEYNRKIHSEIGVAPVQRMIAGPSVVRTCPGPDALRHAFRQRERRTQRRSDGTVSIEGVRFEVPSRLRHLERLEVRYARWDLSSADVVDPTNPRLVIATLYPLDKASNADGVRRALQPSVLPATSVTPKKPVGVAPLLGKLIADYRATGLPPAYLPKHDLDHEANEEESK